MCRKQQQQHHSDSNWIKMLNQFLKPLFNLSETLSCPCSKLSLDLYICWGSYYRSTLGTSTSLQRSISSGARRYSSRLKWMEVPSKVFVSGNRNCYYGFCVAPPKLGVPSPKYENVLQHLVSGDEYLWRFIIWLKLFSICEYGSFFAYYYTRQLNFNHKLSLPTCPFSAKIHFHTSVFDT